MNRAKWFCLLAACLLSLSLGLGTLAQDQSSARGNLSGVVLDASKSTVPGAQVTITGPIGNSSQTTNDQGTFLFSTLIPGFYSIRVQKAGFKVANIAATEVLINKTTSLEVVLETGEVTQTVEVSAATVTVDTSAASVNSDFSDSFYSKIPLGRGVSSLFYLAPGVTSGIGTGVENPSISGSSGLENLYVADGVSINDPAFGGIGVWSRVYGPLGTGINLSFVKEVQIKTGGFEPQYGHVSGGIIQLVTKSGGTKFFGTIGGYFNSRWMQDTYQNSDDPKFATKNLVGSRLENANYEGDFELGGYVPVHGLRDRLFFFGTFNPSQNHAYFAPAAGSGLATLTPTVDRQTTRYDYAAKLTFKINNSHSLESSVSGDPSHTNPTAFNTLNTDNTSANSKWDYGTRQWATRYDGAFGNSVLVDAAFTWGWNHFTETPATNIYQIADNTQIAGLSGQRGAFLAQGIGVLEPYEANTKGISGDVTNTFHFAGTHSINVGYNWQYPHYNERQFWSGPKYPIPTLNATDGDPGYDTHVPPVAGQMTDSNFSLSLAGAFAPGADGLYNAATNPNDTSCTLCPFMNVPGYATPVRVVLQQVRGRFDGGVTKSSGKYHAGYINDAWQINKYVTLNAGVRWEQQRLTGNQVEKTFSNMWSPRAGIIVDPKGDRKQKIYANFGRYAYVLPLDAAIRALSNEEDFQNSYWAPANAPCTVSGATNPTCVTLNSLGSTDFTPASANLLNKATGGIPIAAGPLTTGGEPFSPGTRMEFTDEFLVGYDREFKGGVVASVRYIDRRLKRVIEDQGGISVEQFNALLSNGGGLNYSIGNPNAKQDVFINPNEILFAQGTTFVVPTDASGTALPLTPVNEPLYLAAGMPAACFDKFGFGTPFVAYNQSNGFNAANGGAIAGSACFPAVNTSAWTDASGNQLPNAVSDPNKCSPVGARTPVAGCAYFGGEFIPDGKPDTYRDPKREYEAVEFEVRKAFTHNWALSVNYRVAQLRGNYEGAFRNDNGQADPGISSLFDLTEGALGLLQNQQSIGFLSTDRKHVLNAHSTFVVPNGKLKGFVIGGGVSVLSGNPLSTLVAQQAYVQPGEVPIFGRGDLGRSPVTGSVDAHLEYPFKLSERMQVKVAFDLFNIMDSTRNTTVQQFYDLNFGLKNLDFAKPVSNSGLASPAGFVNQGFVNPFASRLSVLFTF